MNYAESHFKGKRVSLLGAGVSNMPLAAMAAPVAKELTVRDRKSPEELGENARRLLAMGARLITGEDYLCGIDEDLVFRSPGIRPDLDELNEARARGSVVTSEMELFLNEEPCPVYAVTGSDGKTTTTTLTSLLLDSPKLRGKVVLGGNIGEPLLYRIDSVTPDDACAVELSSFQLMTVDAPVKAAAITNITPNHLNWHTGMDEYTDAKANILKRCGRAVLNWDNAVTRSLAARLPEGVPVTWFSLSPLPENLLRSRDRGDSAVWLDPDGTIYESFPDEGIRRVMTRADIKLPGLHNTANYMTAIALTHGATTPERILETARTFGGVEHRLEFVREKDGVTFINGSIDSSPTRTAAALSALSDRPVVLIAGGYDKHIPYEPLADAVLAPDSTVRRMVLTGDTAEKIRAAMESHPAYRKAVENGFKLTENPDFDSAVRDAAASALPGDTVILSPASASFDHFKNFEERGRHFKELVRAL
ncbi:MAG: UDP-N-acetylmuramoyl-L-alanine--D-glutamate ligase [Ruminococcaceae bacterium]|jgi:UDP-N-acetylmuramoylalanine--D-glutamate ligase|nr:UDP-N-acetylmuramoyl-L-alanine--D-glutamate ligase [Oscillospiraceae bacterium]